MLNPKRILITGGGSGGHILPLLTVVNFLRQRYKNLDFLYLGSGNNLERDLVAQESLEYQKISTGKLRRYFAWQNFVDFLRVLKGFNEAWKILRQYKPQVIFSKGGYVSVPVCLAAYLQKIPIVLHESDAVMGLANRMIARLARRICTNFDLNPVKQKHKYLITGLPARINLAQGKPRKMAQKLGFNLRKPIILVMGGSQGAQFINEMVYQNLDELLTKMQIMHITGKGKRQLIKKVGYVSYEYVQEELPDLYALAQVVVSRAGANALTEIAALGLPNVLIPLPSAANQHQHKNAELFQRTGASILLPQTGLNGQNFVKTIVNLVEAKKQQEKMQKNLKKLYNPRAAELIGKEILRFC